MDKLTVTDADREAFAKIIGKLPRSDFNIVLRVFNNQRELGRLQGLEEAAGVAEGTRSYDDALQKSAGCATVGSRIATAIRALKG